MKICFIVPDGVGVRNYLYSNIISNFPAGTEVVIYTPLAEEIMEDIKKRNPNQTIIYERMPLYRESITAMFLKEAITYARLLHFTRLDNNPTTMINWTRKKHRRLSVIFNALNEFAGRFLMPSYPWILRFEKILEKMTRNTRFVKSQKAALKKMAPDAIFCTHQRSNDAAAIMVAAIELEIPTTCAIYSWDNLPKARLLVRSRYYITWSGYMKEEMKKYYPEISDENIIVTGTPQFEFYHDSSLHVSREEFCKQTGLDPGRKILCFSGNDLTFPCDELYLRDVAEAVSQLPPDEQPQILLRRCPVDLSGRFEPVTADFPELIKKSDPLWKKLDKGWQAIIPTTEDVALLVNVSLHSDAVINVGSTMAHDFAVFGKPAIYINYDQPTVTYWSAVTNNQYQHFRSMPDKDCVIWLNSKHEIKEVVKQALNGHKPFNSVNGQWFGVIALQPVTVASKNIAQVLTNLAKS